MVIKLLLTLRALTKYFKRDVYVKEIIQIEKMKLKPKKFNSNCILLYSYAQLFLACYNHLDLLFLGVLYLVFDFFFNLF